jgi:hypothetical protein
MNFNLFVSLIEKTGSKKLGSILLAMGAITQNDLERALHIKRDNPEKLLGQIIVEKGFSSKENVNLALDEQRKENRIGTLLITAKILKQEQLDEALDEQKISREKLGKILIRKGYATDIQINNALKFQKRDNRLGTLLVREGFITEENLEEVVKIQEERGCLLGEILIEMEFISEEQLTDALLKQSAPSY